MRFGVARSVGKGIRLGGSLIAIAIACGLGGPALAGGGVLEINQACAANSGCFPGDAPGFPVVVTAAAGATSFRLTSDLTVPDFIDGLLVLSDDTAIDLGGFRIASASCAASSSASCAALGATSIGIDATSSRGLSVRNGRIVGTGFSGIAAGEWADVEDVEVSWHSGSGLDLGEGARVIGCRSIENAGAGLTIAAHGLVQASHLAYNGTHGLDASTGPSIVRDVVSTGNGATGILVVDSSVESSSISASGATGVTESDQSGISCLGRCVIARNHVTESVADGILCSSECAIHANHVLASGDDGISCSVACVIDGNIADDSTDEGIRMINGGRIHQNSITDTGDDGIAVGTTSAYTGNSIRNVGDAYVTGTGDDLGGNICGAAACP